MSGEAQRGEEGEMAEDGSRPGAPSPDEERTVGELVLDVSERTSILIREEIELAKTEVAEKVGKIARGSAAGIAAALFLVLTLAMLMHAGAWLLNDLFFEDNVWLGFLIEAGIWLVLAGVAVYLAIRSVRAGAPPTPKMAIEEAKLTRETFGGGS